MGCGSFGVAQILVGLHRVGVVGLRDALKEAEAAGLSDREEIVDLLLETLAGDNYLPDAQSDLMRTAIWREYLRYRGEDFSAFYSEAEVTVRGEEGESRDRFVEMLRSVFGDFELEPVVAFAPARGDGPYPQLVVGEEVLVRGLPGRAAFKTAVRKSFSDW